MDMYCTYRLLVPRRLYRPGLLINVEICNISYAFMTAAAYHCRHTPRGISYSSINTKGQTSRVSKSDMIQNTKALD